jgi:uncharacterized OB-fold protein
MAFGFESGAVYVPRFARDDRSVLAPDEDPFSMAIDALERLSAPTAGGAPSRIALVGEFPSVVEAALPAYFGRPLALSQHGGDAEGLATALRAAADPTSEGPSLLLAVDRTGPRGAEAVALRFGPSPVAPAPTWVGAPGSEGAADALVRALAGVGNRAVPRPSGPAPPTEWDPDRVGAFVSLTPNQVSEGAYVPRPRYLENLPSRWRLEADRCEACGAVTFPRRGACRRCGRKDELTAVPLPRDGARVVAATAIGKGGQPTEFDPQVDAIGGYAVVLAEFAPGVRLTLQVTDAAPGGVRIGDRIGTRLRRLYPMDGEWRYGRKAVPLPV